MSEALCPDPEALAALAEHQPSTARREALIRHITECQDCYVAFVETVRLLDTVASSGQAAARRLSIPIPRATVEPGRLAAAWPGHWLLPGAAAALLAIGIGISLQVTRRQTAPPVAQAFPGVARPHEDVPPPEVRLPEAAIQRDTPAWIEGAPWNSISRSRSGFASVPSTRQAFLLGMHLASLDRACRETAPAVMQQAVGEIDRSLRAGGLVRAGERRRLVAQARSQDCLFHSHVEEAATPWLFLGRALEDWRIAAVERTPSAFDPERQRNLGRLLAVVDLEKPARLLGARLAQPPRPSDGEPWDSLVNDLVELIELLCV